MRLATLTLKNHLILAPMAGISDYPFRRIAREMGCGLAFTGLISAEGLLRKRESYLRIERDDHPLSVQLFGSNPDILAEAARWVEEMGADAVDINMGCPARQVTAQGAGVDLMRFPERVDRILKRVRKALKVPFSVKIRSGWDRDHINAVRISKIAEENGVDAIILHPRTKVQEFRGQADWELIREVKQSVSIPVIGNGDVTTPLLAEKMIEKTGCDGVMIGRGALGNPWIFSEVKEGPSPSVEERKRVLRRHLSLLESHYGEKEATEKMKRQVTWYSKGLPVSALFRNQIFALKEKEALFEAIESYFDRRIALGQAL